MKIIEMTGKTVDDALKNALKELNLTEDKVEFEVLEEGSKGLFNLIGSKPAKIKVTVKRDAALESKIFLTNVLNSMGIKADIEVKEENDPIFIIYLVLRWD